MRRRSYKWYKKWRRFHTFFYKCVIVRIKTFMKKLDSYLDTVSLKCMWICNPARNEIETKCSKNFRSDCCILGFFMFWRHPFLHGSWRWTLLGNLWLIFTRSLCRLLSSRLPFHPVTRGLLPLSYVFRLLIGRGHEKGVKYFDRCVYCSFRSPGNSWPPAALYSEWHQWHMCRPAPVKK